MPRKKVKKNIQLNPKKKKKKPQENIVKKSRGVQYVRGKGIVLSLSFSLLFSPRIGEMEFWWAKRKTREPTNFPSSLFIQSNIIFGGPREKHLSLLIFHPPFFTNQTPIKFVLSPLFYPQFFILLISPNQHKPIHPPKTQKVDRNVLLNSGM